jgi:hypothetical protein
MTPDAAQAALRLAKAMQVEVNQHWLPPDEVEPSLRELVLSLAGT